MTIKTAMLMAAGMGTRMRPLTNNCPKPLIEVAGRTLIDRTLDNLITAGVEKAVINVHYLADMVEAHFAERTDIEVIFSDERDELLETGGGVVKALPLLGNDPVLVCNTDAFWLNDNGQTINSLVSAFNPEKMDSLLLLARRENSMGYHGLGDFDLAEDKQLIRRGDKPEAQYVFSGIYAFNPTTISHLNIEKFSANVYWNESASKNRLLGHVMTPFWMHVGDPQAVEDASALIEQRTA